MDTFATRLKYARRLKRMSQAELARASGLSQSAISSYERGNRLSPTKLRPLAQALHVSLYWLSDGMGPIHTSGPSAVELATGERTPTEINAGLRPAWPFASIDPQLFWQLTPDQQAMVERTVAILINGLRAPSA